jgi:VWFA-related protein
VSPSLGARLGPAFPFVLLLAVSVLGAQEPTRPAARPTAPGATATFPAQVEQVTVDLVVVDRRTGPMPGLTKDDFILNEDGKPQPIVSFESVVVAAPRPAAASPVRVVSSNLHSEKRRARTFLILFDDVHLSPEQAWRAKGAVAQFLNKAVSEGDQVTLVSAAGDAWWTATLPQGRDSLLAVLKRLDGRYVPDTSPDRLTEYEALRIDVYQDPEVAARVNRRFQAYTVHAQDRPTSFAPQDANTGERGIIDPTVRSRASEVYQQSTSRNKITLSALERAIQSLAGTKGRKSLVLVSQGFVYDMELREMKRVVDASRRLNVPIYFIDTRGLVGMPDTLNAVFGPPIDTRDVGVVLGDISRDAEGSESLASDTGGFAVRNTNDLGGGIARIAAESRVYYLLGYNPANTARDGKFRKIEVKLAAPRKGVEVRARRGYYAPSDDAPPVKRLPGALDPELQRVLDSPFEADGISLRATAYTFDETTLGRALSLVAAEVDIQDLAFEEKNGQLEDTLELLIVAQHRESGEYFRYDQKIEMSLMPGTREKLARTWYPVSREFELPSGGFQARIVVRDLKSGKVGSVVHEFVVPRLGELRVSSPILADELLPAEGAALPRPALLARRTFFAPLGRLYLQYNVYGAARDAVTTQPRVTGAYTLRRSDGTVARRVEPSRIEPTSIGALQRLIGISLQGVAAGEYTLVLAVKDELGAKSLELSEPFTIVP